MGVTLNAADLRQLERRWWTRMTAVGVVYFSIALGLFIVVAPEPPGEDRTRTAATLTAVLGATIVALIPVGVLRARSTFRLATAWIAEDRAPTHREIRRALSVAWDGAMIIAICGAAASVVAAVAVAALYRPIQALSAVVGGAICTTGAWLFGLITGERVLSPVTVVVTSQYGTAAVPSIGIVGRVLVAWGEGLLLPVAAFLMSPDQVGLTAVQWAVLVTGVAVSLALMAVTTTAVVRSLGAVGTALRRVRAGDLDAHITVDDTGDIGQLGMAFNEMVEGLRQHDQLDDLFGRHVGRDVARRAMSEGDHIGGEMSEATVLFVDVIGSTALADDLGADEVVVILNAFFKAVVDVVESEGGWVNKFEGDGALCLFGAPEVLPDHAARGLRSGTAPP